MISINIKSLALAAAAAMSFAGAASAATVTTDGQATSGNCPASAPCILLANEGPNSTATFSAGGASFSLTSFLYAFTTNSDLTETGPGVLTLTYAGLDSPINLYGNADGSPYTFSTPIADLTEFTLSNTGIGSIRIDDVATTISAVPVPASGLLLLGALGMMASRRRKAAA